MKRILVVEDSHFFGLMMKKTLQKEMAYDVTWAQSLSEAIKALDETGNDFFAAILDFDLPDAHQGEIIDEVISRGIPTIVYTASMSADVRSFVWSRKVLDYATKDNPQSISQIVSLLKRIEKNVNIEVMVVDDSTSSRKMLTDLLKVHHYQTLSASDGKEALDLLAEHPDTKLVITDFNMPNIDGIQLTHGIRQDYSKDELAIIGISSEGDNLLAASFLKSGANDFIIKQSFLTEEFYCRVTRSVENLERIHLIKEASIKDYLTGLDNRRHFFDVGKKLFANAMRENLGLVCAMIDIDHFKAVNDTYGHEVGDLTLQHVSTILKHRLRQTDMVARMGGEEFCVLAVNMGHDNTRPVFDQLRTMVAESALDIGNGQEIRVTVSIGVAMELADSLEEMVNHADALLYQAKESGRNRVITSNE